MKYVKSAVLCLMVFALVIPAIICFWVAWLILAIGACLAVWAEWLMGHKVTWGQYMADTATDIARWSGDANLEVKDYGKEELW